MGELQRGEMLASLALTRSCFSFESHMKTLKLESPESLSFSCFGWPSRGSLSSLSHYPLVTLGHLGWITSCLHSITANLLSVLLYSEEENPRLLTEVSFVTLYQCYVICPQKEPLSLSVIEDSFFDQLDSEYEWLWGSWNLLGGLWEPWLGLVADFLMDALHVCFPSVGAVITSPYPCPLYLDYTE